MTKLSHALRRLNSTMHFTSGTRGYTPLHGRQCSPIMNRQLYEGRLP